MIGKLQGEFFHVVGMNKAIYLASTQQTKEQPVWCVSTEQGQKFYCSGKQTWTVISQEPSSQPSVLQPQPQPMPTIDEEAAPLSPVKSTTRSATNKTQPQPTVRMSVVPTDKLAVGMHIMNMLSDKAYPVFNPNNPVNDHYTDGYVIGSISGLSNGMITWSHNPTNTTAKQVITKWIIKTDYTVVNDNTPGMLVATSKVLRDEVEKYGLTNQRLPSSVWSMSDEFRHGFVDALVSHHGTLYADQNKASHIELKSDAPSVVGDIAMLFNMYGIVNASNGERIKVDANTFAKVFRVTNPSMQGHLSKLSAQVSPISASRVVSVEKTNLRKKMLTVVNHSTQVGYKTSLGFTGT